MLDGAVKTHSDILTNVGIMSQIFYGLGTLWWGKIDLVVRSIDENPGRLVVWSDVDIRFFRLSPGDLESTIE